jgi:hypothetical protein
MSRVVIVIFLSFVHRFNKSMIVVRNVMKSSAANRVPVIVQACCTDCAYQAT